MAFFVLFGLALRIFRYALRLPLVSDEAFLGINILDRSYRQLLAPLEYIQVAPLGFIWAERAIHQLLGMSEYAMRLLSTFAGVAALILFAFWVRRILSPLAATIAVGVLAVSDLAVRLSVELKPYGIDLFFAVALLYPATLFLLNRQNRYLVLLIALAPVALFFSLPSVFVAAGIAATLITVFRRRLTARQRLLTAVLSAVILLSFGALAWKFIGPQFAGSGPSQQICWTFPPLNPLQFAAWFLTAHSDNLFGYPLDLSSPGSGLFFLLAVIGLISLLRSSRGPIALLLLAPFLMTFAAALLRRYPYGDSPRVAQHLVGPICLLIGAGAAAVIQRFSISPQAQRATALTIFASLVLIGLIGPAMLVVSPSSETRRDRAIRQFVAEQLTGVDGRTTVAAMQRPDLSDALVRWYLHASPAPPIWGADIAKLPSLPRPLRVFATPIDAIPLPAELAAAMSAPADQSEIMIIPHEVHFAAFYYSAASPRRTFAAGVPATRLPAGRLPATQPDNLFSKVVDRIQ
jgi:hypothetical protein